MEHAEFKKKKILMTATSMGIGGTETFVTNVIKSIDLEKFQVDFYIYDGNRMEHAKEVVARNGKIFVSPVKAKGKFAVIKEILALKKFLKTHPYDIVHCNECSFAGILMGTVAAKLDGRSVVISHSHNTGQPKNTFVDRFLRFLFKIILEWSVDYGFSCSDFAGESKYTKRFMQSGRYTIIHNAINTKKYVYNWEYRNTVRKKYNLREEDFVIGNVGRLASAKNQTFLLDIMAKLLEEKEAYLMIVGEGECRAELEQKAQNLGISEHVILVGASREAEKYYSAMDLLVMPSLFEGFPYTAVEAQVNGLKCIMSDHITKTVNISGDVTFVGLDESLDHWVKAVLKTEGKRSFPEKTAIVLHDYELKNEVKRLEGIYQKGI